MFLRRNAKTPMKFLTMVLHTPLLYALPRKKIKDLNTLRNNFFVRGGAKSTCVKLPYLEPTADAAFGPFKIVYLQIET